MTVNLDGIPASYNTNAVKTDNFDAFLHGLFVSEDLPANTAPLKHKKIGMIAGMGPDAGAYYLGKVADWAREHFGAKCDQDHPNVEPSSRPTIPDRSKWLLNELNRERLIEELKNDITLTDAERIKRVQEFTEKNMPEHLNPLPYLKEMLLDFHKSGIKMVFSAINSYHGFYDRLITFMKEKGIDDMKLLHAGEEAAEFLATHHPDKKVLGVIGSKFTMDSELFKKQLEAKGFTLLYPNKDELDWINKAVYSAKEGKMAEAGESFYKAAKMLEARGAQIGLETCSEIPPAMEAFFAKCPHLKADYKGFDTLKPAALKAMEHSIGRTPIFAKAAMVLGVIASAAFWFTKGFNKNGVDAEAA